MKASDKARTRAPGNIFMRSRLNKFRRSSQAAALLLIGEFSFYGIFRCPFAVPYVSCANCPVVQCPGRQLVYPFWIILGISALLFGRSFCGWACPAGLASEIFNNLSRLGKKLRPKIDYQLHLFKYPALITFLFLWLWMFNPRWAVPIRTGEFWKSVLLTFEHADNLWLIRTGAFTGLLALGGFLGNIWCRYLCPAGGALDIFGKIGLFQFRKAGDCGDCGKCREVCDMGTEPGSYNCSNCGECKEVCPSKNVYFGRPRK